MTRRHAIYAVKFIAADGKPDLVTFNERDRAAEAAKTLGSTVTMHMVGSDAFPKVKLSDAQKAFLRGFAQHGYSRAPDGRINASAWHRTCNSLVDMGLVSKTGFQSAGLTWLGLAWAVTL